MGARAVRRCADGSRSRDLWAVPPLPCSLLHLLLASLTLRGRPIETRLRSPASRYMTRFGASKDPEGRGPPTSWPANELDGRIRSPSCGDAARDRTPRAQRVARPRGPRHASRPSPRTAPSSTRDVIASIRPHGRPRVCKTPFREPTPRDVAPSPLSTQRSCYVCMRSPVYYRDRVVAQFGSLRPARLRRR